MSISMYDQSIAPLTRMLNNLAAIVAKAEAHVEAEGIDPTAILTARLSPDMLTFMHQIRFVSDTARGAAARLAGVERPVMEDNETTFAEALDRINRTIAYLGEFTPEQFDGADEKTIDLQFGPDNVMAFSGKDYLLGFVMPNFYFHVSTSYAILRHNGVKIGKIDYLGAPQ
ncbi:MAG: DUF1993 domain-containing protein [Chloroflexota bacterium]